MSLGQQCGLARQPCCSNRSGGLNDGGCHEPRRSTLPTEKPPFHEPSGMRRSAGDASLESGRHVAPKGLRKRWRPARHVRLPVANYFTGAPPHLANPPGQTDATSSLDGAPTSLGTVSSDGKNHSTETHWPRSRKRLNRQSRQSFLGWIWESPEAAHGNGCRAEAGFAPGPFPPVCARRGEGLSA